MAKALRFVAKVASVVAVIAPFFGPVGVAVAAIATAVAAVASIGAALLAKPPKQPGTSTSYVFDPDGPIPYAMGRTFVAGRAIHRESWGKDNQYQGFVNILSGGGPHHSLDQFLVDNSPTSISAGAITGALAGFMWLSSQLGATPEAASLQPAAAVGSLPGWGATHKLSGYAADLWTLKFDTKGKKYSSGVPKRGWVGRWAKVYDPRLDSTYPGGSGAQRWDNEATWAYSENPWLHALTWEIGRRAANGSGQTGAAFAGSQLYLGVGKPITGIDLPSYVFAANVADANAWTISGVVYSNEDKWTISKTIAQAGGGEPVHLGDMTSAFVQTPRVAVETITAKDLVGPVSIPTDRPFQERINRIVPKIISEAHGWEMVTMDPIGVSAWKTQDREQWRTEDAPFRLVSSKNQAAQLGLYRIADSRERNPIVLALKPRWKGYGPGSCVNLNIPEYGLSNVKAIVLDRQEDAANRIVILTFRSENDAKHALALAATGNVPPGVNLIPPDASAVPAPIGGSWAAAGGSLANGGAQLPAIIITGAVDNPNAEQVIFEYKDPASSEWIMGGTEKADTTRKEISSVAPGDAYDVAISYVVRGVVGARRILGPVTVGDQIANNSNALGGTPSATVLASLAAARASATFVQPTAPTAAESVIGNTWFNDVNGYMYDRIDDTGFTIGGDTPAIGGDAPFLVWTPSPNQPVVAAYEQAAAAQLTATIASAAASAAQAAADLANAAIAEADDDGVISISEKIETLKPGAAAFEAFYNSVVLNANAAGIPITTLNTRRTNWLAALAAISPPWDDVNVASPVVRNSLDSARALYDEELKNVQRLSIEAMTAAKQVVVVPPGPQSVYRDWQGNIKSSQYPRTLTPKVERGGVDIRDDDDVSYSITTTGSIVATVNNTTGSADKGKITPTDGSSGSIVLTVTVAGVVFPTYTIPFTAFDDNPPTVGGGGGGANTGGSDSTLEDVTSETFAIITQQDAGESVFLVDITSTSQTINCVAPLGYSRTGVSPSLRAMVAKWRYKLQPSGTPTDFPGSPITGTGTGYDNDAFDIIPGEIIANQSVTGLASGTYEVWLEAAKESTFSGSMQIFYGTATVSRS